MSTLPVQSPFQDYAAYERRLGSQATGELINRFETIGVRAIKFENSQKLIELLAINTNVNQFHYFGHGDPYDLLVTYNHSDKDKNTDITLGDTEIYLLSDSNPNFFAKDAVTFFWTCNVATGSSKAIAYRWANLLGLKLTR